MLHFVADVGGYKVRVDEQTPGLWRMIATGEERAHVQFTNVYHGIEQALRDAEVFACYALELWGICLSGPIEWRAACSDIDFPGERSSGTIGEDTLASK